jgi:hypothetical protein
MLHVRRTATAFLVSITGVALGGGAPAQASDAGLRKVVKVQEATVAPLARAFQQADAALTAGSDTNTVSAAAGTFRKGLRTFKTAVVPIKTESSRSALGKKRLLSAIREFDLGLIEYQSLLDKVNGGASRGSVQSSFQTLNRRFREAAADEASALRLLKISP